MVVARRGADPGLVVAEIIDLLGSPRVLTPDNPPPPPPPPPPPGTWFHPTSISFDSGTYAPGDTITVTVTGDPAADGSLPTVTKTDPEGRAWTVIDQTASTITLQTTA